MRRWGLLLSVSALALLSLASCTSDPYVVRTTLNPHAQQKTERICTHKRAVVPFYAVAVAGWFPVTFGRSCHDETTPITDPSRYAKPAKKDEVTNAEEETDQLYRASY